MGDQLHKYKQQLVDNVSTYGSMLEDTNVLKDGKFSIDQFRAFEQGTMDQDTAKEFRVHLREAMLLDLDTVQTLMDRSLEKQTQDYTIYGKIAGEAWDERTRLIEDSNRKGASKVVHDLFGTKKKRAIAKLQNLHDVQDKIKVNQSIHNDFQKTRSDFRAMRANHITESEEMIRKAITYCEDEIKTLQEWAWESGLSNEEIEELPEMVELKKKRATLSVEKASAQQQAGACLLNARDLCTKHEQQAVTEGKEEEIAAEKEKIRAKYQKIFDDNKRLVLKFKPGVFNEALLLHSKQIDTVKAKCDAFRAKHAKDLSTDAVEKSDILRDLPYWTSQVSHASSVSDDSMLRGYNEIAAVVKLKREGKPPEMRDQDVRNTLLSPYLILTDFRHECEDLMHEHKKLFSTNPPYNELVKHVDIVRDVYSKAQSLTNIGFILNEAIEKIRQTEGADSPIFEGELITRAADAYRFVAAMRDFSNQITIRGTNWDAETGAYGDVPVELQNPCEIKTLEEYMESKKEKLAQIH